MRERRIGQNRISKSKLYRCWYEKETRLLSRGYYGFLTYKKGRKGGGKGKLKEFISYKGRGIRIN